MKTTTQRLIKLLVADDHQILLEGLRELLNRHFHVMACVSSGHQLVTMAAHLKPEIIVTDIHMPDLSGIEAMRKIRAEGLTARAVFLTMLHDANIAMQAFQVGGLVAGYVLKNSAGTELVTAIYEVYAGRSYMTPRITRDVLLLREWCQTSTETAPGLTPRQTEVLRLIVQGKTMKEVASSLSISTRTAEAHKYQMMEHLGFKTTAQLIRFAVQNGLMPPPPNAGLSPEMMMRSQPT